jgi:hypothetical protein
VVVVDQVLADMHRVVVELVDTELLVMDQVPFKHHH